MSSGSNLGNKKCPKCEKVRLKDIPRSQYFSIKSNESLEIANRLRPDIEIKLNDFICVNCYKKAKRIEIKQDSPTHEKTPNEPEILANDIFETVDQKRSKNESVKDLISSLIEASKKKNFFVDFADLNSIDEETCKEKTGFFKNEFEKINGYLGEMKDSNIRTKSQALAIYLFWLKTGLNQEAIKAHFRIENRTDISRYCEQVRTSLSQFFVPEFLGCDALKREEWVNQKSIIAKELYSLSNEQLVVIAVLTFIVKRVAIIFSKENRIHAKKRPLVKPFILCTTNGLIINAYWPFPATLNDAKIIQECYRIDSNLDLTLRGGDIILVDRGFRDATEFLEKNNLIFKPGSTVFFVRIQSRHSGNSIYKVYVSYLTESSIKNDTLINGWYFTCKNGTRTVGCCSHVSSIIYYFGYARYLENIPKPAIDGPTQSTQKKRKKNSQKKSKTKTFSSDSDKTIQESEKEDDGEPCIPNSNDREKSKSTPLHSLPITLNIDFLLCDLNNSLTRIRLVNTCTIDYFLLGLWYASKIKTSFKSQLDLSNLEIKIYVLLIIDLIEKNEWNKSKSIWITNV
ncbi:unnamed protein product [Brachionus calyciflorus]|uniref:DDE Tnp4 domain-containing protein n=1 Tax=Brachionus calyciflorus TaxID=104777 RepID=A0A813R7U8_9BILA|nr:unnamed protein product [Brachionus calyciflorus]